ncbi:MAG: DUF1254 domain-containing protein [Gammaproteobacteria bacterium]
MKHKGKAFVVLIFAMLLVGIQCLALPPAKLDQQEALKLATEAYIYGYPLVLMDVTKKVSTNVAAPKDMNAPIGQFANLRTFPNANFKTVVSPNADTLYSAAWLNLSKEPYVLHVPDTHGRYYLMPMLDAWTNVFASPGSRTTGTQAGNFAIVGPHWRGHLPNGVIEIKSPTDIVWIIGRTSSTGTEHDLAVVREIQNQYTLTPLSSYGQHYFPPVMPVREGVDRVTPPKEQVARMDAATFFNTLATLMKDNPPAAEDAAMVAKLAHLGIISGKPFVLNQSDPVIVEAVKQAPQQAMKEIIARIPRLGKLENGWMMISTGKYGTDYLKRSAVAHFGLGANLPQDAVYPFTLIDNKGRALSGNNRYVLHFAKGHFPPVHAFWSLTMYNDQNFFVHNHLNRYNINSSNKFILNPDGSLDIYIQHDAPGKGKEANWLPAPQGNFNLILRMYWPKQAVLNGTWTPPAVQRV